MPNTSYTSLVELWKQQEERFIQWRVSLKREAEAIRNTVALKIGNSDSWESHDGKERRRYVEILDLSAPENPAVGPLTSEAISDGGELYFGLSFTLDHGAKTYPKSQYHVAIAVRFANSQPQYAFWDTKMSKIEKDDMWLSDKEKFADEIIRRLENYFSFDPFVGSMQRASIGFVRS